MKHEVLIADDDEHLRDLLNLMFQDSFDLQFAETAGQTLDLIKQNTFQSDLGHSPSRQDRP